jgi:hypothetical protein
VRRRRRRRRRRERGARKPDEDGIDGFLPRGRKPSTPEGFNITWEEKKKKKGKKKKGPKGCACVYSYGWAGYDERAGCV